VAENELIEGDNVVVVQSQILLCDFLLVDIWEGKAAREIETIVQEFMQQLFVLNSQGIDLDFYVFHISKG